MTTDALYSVAVDTLATVWPVVLALGVAALATLATMAIADDLP